MCQAWCLEIPPGNLPWQHPSPKLGGAPVFCASIATWTYIYHNFSHIVINYNGVCFSHHTIAPFKDRLAAQLQEVWSAPSRSASITDSLLASPQSTAAQVGDFKCQSVQSGSGQLWWTSFAPELLARFKEILWGLHCSSVSLCAQSCSPNILFTGVDP